jgi:retron-type reverse transcriptase
LDLKRAFETIRNLLLRKFERKGVQNIENQWVESYLDNRMQRMSFNGKYSQPRGIIMGVPQGSVLGPLMFIIYMNNIGSAIKECQYYLFADDTLLSISGNSVQECLEKLNRDLKNLSKWLKFNKLKLNVSKTKHLIMTGTQNSIEIGSMSLKIDGEQIARVVSM